MAGYRLGWFSTGRDEAARDLLQAVVDSIRNGDIKAEIAFVFSNRERGEAEESDRFLHLVESFGIPLVTFSSRRFRKETGQSRDAENWRRDYDREVIRQLKGFQAGLVVLAGYMLIMSGELCQHYLMLNLHPALPGGPVGTWQEVMWQLIEARAEKTGAMMNLVIPELDKGPPVTYFSFSLQGEPFDQYWREIEGKPLSQLKQEGESQPLFALIRQEELAREFPLIITTIKAVSEGRVRITPERRVVDAQGRPINGYDLSRDIERRLAEKERRQGNK